MGPLKGLRFNHLEITIPRGSLMSMKADLLAFYRDTLGFGTTELDEFGSGHLFLTTDPEGSQFVYIKEHETPALIRGDDHLGFHVDDRAAVDAVLARCEALQAHDTRMQIMKLADLELASTSTHAFYFRYLLPIWFDVQCIQFRPGFEPARRWRYAP